MPGPQSIVSHLYIKIAGAPIADEVLRQVTEVTVDQQVHLPSMFSIRLADPDLTLLDGDLFTVAKPIEIVGETEDQKEILLMDGEITAIEPEFGEGMIAELQVRGYDKLHRLYRTVRSKTYLNVKDSDLANEIAQNAGLIAEVDATRTVYDHLYQDNQSDLHFLMQRAWRIGYACYITAGKLVFRKPTTEAASVTLTWGDDLLAFRPRMTLAEQVEEVVVRGWDVRKKSAIVGRETQGKLYPELEGPKAKEMGGELTKKLGGGSKVVVVDQPVVSQAEADILAAARLNEISGNFIEAEGKAYRRPEIRAGERIKLEALGKRFSGTYLVTSATHLYTDAGFTTTFHVTGARTELLTDQLHAHQRLSRRNGLASAIVTNTDDPNTWGRVKVKYPWMADDEESDWVRVAAAGAGPDAGFSTIPAVDDEVVVGFVHGDFNQPIVLGGLWNGQDQLPPPTAQAPAGEKPLVRSWHSRSGHQITVYDNADDKIEVQTAAGRLLILNDAENQIAIVSK
ncbi:MAG: VgrG-related protein, partial [Caldilineaceae bacterium]|nr:VgrG-related protein [Caldilineaceae bacterium]